MREILRRQRSRQAGERQIKNAEVCGQKSLDFRLNFLPARRCVKSHDFACFFEVVEPQAPYLLRRRAILGLLRRCRKAEARLPFTQGAAEVARKIA